MKKTQETRAINSDLFLAPRIIYINDYKTRLSLDFDTFWCVFKL